MSSKENENRTEFDYSKEIESPVEMDTDSIAESVITFSESPFGTEEMEYYEDDSTRELDIIHRKGNSGVIPNLQLLPTDSRPLPTTEVGAAAAGEQLTDETRVVPGEELNSSEEFFNDEVTVDEITYEEPLPEGEAVKDTYRKDDGADAYADDRAEENDDDSAEDYPEESFGEVYSENADEMGEDTTDYSDVEAVEDATVALVGVAAAAKKAEMQEPVYANIDFLPEDELDDDVPLTRRDVAELGDLSYHDEDVKVPKKKKEKQPSGAHPAQPHGKDTGSKGAPSGKSVGKQAGNARQAGYNKPAEKKKMGVLDIVLLVGASVAILAIVILAVSFIRKTQSNIEIRDVASIGSNLSSIGIIGEEGIEKIVANRAETVIETLPEEKASEKPSEKEVADNQEVSVNFSSMEKDLKIKFSDKKTDRLITGVLFRVDAKTPDNKTVTWEDSDRDGMIYEENLTPGTYYVTILSVDDYKFPTKETAVTVKDKISYTAINIVNEIKKESEVNVAIEDTAAKVVDTGTVLADTVGWVDSGEKTVYTEVPKNLVSEPQTVASAGRSSYSAEPDGEEGTTDPSGGGEGGTDPSGGGEGGGTDPSGGGEGGTDPSGGEGGSGTDPTPTPDPAPEPVKHYVTGVSLNPSSLTLTTGQTAGISATVSKDGDDVDGSVSWSSSDSGIASVDSNGTVTAKAAGNATITCTTNGKKSDGSSATAACTVTVNAPVAYVKGVSLDKTSLSLTAGTTAKLTANVSADSGANTSYTFSTSDGNIATVAADGTVTAKAKGTAVITCTTSGKKSDGNPATATCTVTVAAAAPYLTGLTLDKTTATIALNATLKLVPTVSAEGENPDKTVTWTSSNSSIATVGTDGTVTGKAKGSATITCTTNAKTKDGKTLSVSCTVTVNSAMADTTTALTYKDAEGKVVPLYVKDGENYREAKYADYYKYSTFYIKEVKLYGWQNKDGGTRYYNSEGKYVTGEQVIGGVKYNFANDGTLSTGSGTMGIDVSKWNGSIDWNAVKSSGVSFVIIRCGYRGSTLGGLIEDPNFHTYASGAEAAGLKVGVYFFSQAVNEREAVEEASMAISMAQRHRISYPIFIDSEYGNGSHTARADGLSKAQRTAVCRAFCETIRSAGYTPGVYASKSWYYNNLDAGALNNYKIWLVHYCSATDYKGKYEIWQSSSTGRVNGIKGNVDINTSYLGY